MVRTIFSLCLVVLLFATATCYPVLAAEEKTALVITRDDSLEASLTANGQTFKPHCLSVSPDGNLLLYLYNGTPYIFNFSEGTSKEIKPDYENSVEDTYGKFDRLIQIFEVGASEFYFSEPHNIVWSNDGRFITFTSHQPLNTLRYWFDLFIIDTEKSTVSSKVTYGLRLYYDETSATVLNAAFNEDASAVYFDVYGRVDENSGSRLLSYNMKTGEISSLFHADRFGPLESIGLSFSNGYLYHAVRRNDALSYIAVFESSGAVKTASLLTKKIENSLARPTNFTLAPDGSSGILLYNLKTGSETHILYTLYDTKENKAADGFIAIPVDNDGYAKLLNGQELKDGRRGPREDWQNLLIGNAQYTPDGCYILLFTISVKGYELYLMRVSDMKLFPVYSDVEADLSMMFDYSTSSNYRAGYLMFNNNIFITDGNLYRYNIISE
jgi:hypothetical protein